MLRLANRKTFSSLTKKNWKKKKNMFSTNPYNCQSPSKMGKTKLRKGLKYNMFIWGQNFDRFDLIFDFKTCNVNAFVILGTTYLQIRDTPNKTQIYPLFMFSVCIKKSSLLFKLILLSLTR
jgi:hypothetical protein